MVALVGREHEQRVALVDPVAGEALEELAERSVIPLKRGDVARLTWPVRRSGQKLVVGVVDVGIGNGDSVLLHVGDVRQRDLGRHPRESGEADVA